MFDSIYLWNAYHSIFTIPHNYTTGHFTPEITYGTPGDYLAVTTGTALGGWFVIPRDGNASIVLGATGRTLFNSFVIDEFSNDLDDSTYADNFELWENEIAYMLRPLLTHPDDVYMTEGDYEEITWTWDPPAQLYGTPAYYCVIRLDTVVLWSGFVGGYSFIRHLASLSHGTYTYDLTILGRFGFTDNDSVVVHIEEAPPSTTTDTTTTTTTSQPTTGETTTTTSSSTTPSVGPSGIPELYLVGLTIGGICVIVVLIAIFYKTRSVPAKLG